MISLGRVLVLAPHPDDAEYGVGPLLAALPPLSAEIVVLVSCPEVRQMEAWRSATTLGVRLRFLGLAADGELADELPAARALDELVESDRRRTTILAPHPDDAHRDHRAAARLGRVASRHGRADLLYFRTPSTGPSFVPRIVVPASAVEKIRAAEALAEHRTQAERPYFGSARLDAQWLDGTVLDPHRLTLDRPGAPDGPTR